VNRENIKQKANNIVFTGKFVWSVSRQHANMQCTDSTVDISKRSRSWTQRVLGTAPAGAWLQWMTGHGEVLVRQVLPFLLSWRHTGAATVNNGAWEKMNYNSMLTVTAYTTMCYPKLEAITCSST